MGSAVTGVGVRAVRRLVGTRLGRRGIAGFSCGCAYVGLRGPLGAWPALFVALPALLVVEAILESADRRWACAAEASEQLDEPAEDLFSVESTNVPGPEDPSNVPGPEDPSEQLGGADVQPFVVGHGAPLPADHPAEGLLRACADWQEAQRYVCEDLLFAGTQVASADEAAAAGFLPVVLHAAAVMEEDTRRVRKWLAEIEDASTMSELDSIERWQRNPEALDIVIRTATLEPRRREEIVRLIESRLRRCVDPLAQAIAPAIFTPEGVRRTRQLLHRRVYGQDSAVEAVVGRLEIAAAGLADEDKPMGSFLFLGPTGVGKTEMARVLAEGLPDGASALAIFDMGQYKHEGDRTKLVGWTLGGVDSNRDGAMVAHVREHPYSVLVFDEIEKAHPAMFDLLLGMLDRARVQDQYGNDVSLADALIVFTSNVERDELRDVFRPEFLNRIDETIEFAPLTHATLLRVFDKLFAEIQTKVLRRRGIRLEITDAARDRLIDLSAVDDQAVSRPPVGFGVAPTVGGGPRELGARPLARVLDREVERRLAEAINAGRVSAGDELTLAVDAERRFALAPAVEA